MQTVLKQELEKKSNLWIKSSGLLPLFEKFDHSTTLVLLEANLHDSLQETGIIPKILLRWHSGNHKKIWNLFVSLSWVCHLSRLLRSPQFLIGCRPVGSTPRRVRKSRKWPTLPFYIMTRNVLLFYVSDRRKGGRSHGILKKWESRIRGFRRSPEEITDWGRRFGCVG